MISYHLMFFKKKNRIYSFFAMLILGFISCNHKQKAESEIEKDSVLKKELPINTTEKNRKIMEDFADIFYRQKEVSKAFEKYVEDYIQHNPNILDGRNEAIKALTLMFSSPTSHFEIIRIMVDGNMAMIHIHGRKDKESKGGSVADIYRLENGKIVEHWDILQSVPEKSINPHPMF